jgi:hypothetical protein
MPIELSCFLLRDFRLRKHTLRSTCVKTCPAKYLDTTVALVYYEKRILTFSPTYYL